MALFQSLCEHSDEFVLWVLALDPPCVTELRRIRDNRLRVVSLTLLEKNCPALRACRRTRSLIEYYFTCSPVFIQFVLERLKSGETVTKLDADGYFFSSPKKIHELEGKCSLAITPHRFTSNAIAKEIYGKYNVGWVTIRKDRTGILCAEEWKNKTLAWCRDKPEKNRFADQKYLDQWPSRYRGVRVLDIPGINQAPWNSELSYFKSVKNDVFVDEHPLLFFHFHSLRQGEDRKFYANLTEFMIRPNMELVKKVYIPYVDAILGVQATYGLSGRNSHVPRHYEDSSYLRRQSHARNVCSWASWNPVQAAEKRAIFF